MLDHRLPAHVEDPKYLLTQQAPHALSTQSSATVDVHENHILGPESEGLKHTSAQQSHTIDQPPHDTKRSINFSRKLDLSAQSIGNNSLHDVPVVTKAPATSSAEHGTLGETSEAASQSCQSPMPSIQPPSGVQDTRSKTKSAPSGLKHISKSAYRLVFKRHDREKETSVQEPCEPELLYAGSNTGSQAVETKPSSIPVDVIVPAGETVEHNIKEILDAITMADGQSHNAPTHDDDSNKDIQPQRPRLRGGGDGKNLREVPDETTLPSGLWWFAGGRPVPGSKPQTVGEARKTRRESDKVDSAVVVRGQRRPRTFTEEFLYALSDGRIATGRSHNNSRDKHKEKTGQSQPIRGDSQATSSQLTSEAPCSDLVVYDGGRTTR